MKNDEDVIQVSRLTKKYGSFLAADDVSFSVAEGEICGLIGRNGAGKTTIMKMLLNLVKPTSGDMRILGKGMQDGLEEERRKIGSIIETPAFYDSLTAYENLKIRGLLIGHSKEEELQKALKEVGLDAKRNVKVKKYSLGMRQKLGIACALLGEPKILLLDEPINGLDPIAIREIRQVLENVVKKYHTTILISSHILEELSKIATKYVFISDGKVIKQVKASEISCKGNELEEYFVSLVGGGSDE
ncbi:MAG: ATP-binding cassette domain-containing protein [bacterium]|nr:ATP-binding cassette domain-containing protein [bacterium]